MKSVYFVLILGLVSGLNVRADVEGAIDYQNEDSTVVYDETGHFVTTTYRQFQVLSDTGKTELAVQRLPYDAGRMAIKVLEAGIIQNGQKIPLDLARVRKAQIPGLNGSPGMAMGEMIEVPFNGLRLGSQTYIRFQTILLPGPQNQDFGLDITFSPKTAKRTTMEVRSPLKIYAQIDDRKSRLKVKETREGSLYVFRITVRKPFPNQKYHFPRVQISLEDNWRQFTDRERKRYDLSRVTLPGDMAAQVKALSAGKDARTKVAGVLAWMAENYTYSGRWLSVGGGWNPRPLQEISSTKTGDCKDFALTALAMLKALGVEAEPVLVGVGLQHSTPIDKKSPLVMNSYFNHVVFRYKDGSHWTVLDPGRGLADAEHMPGHLHGAPAVNLFAKDPGLYYLEADPKNYARIQLNTEVRPVPSGGYVAHTRADFMGEAANTVRTLYFSNGPAAFNKFFEEAMTSNVAGFHLRKTPAVTRGAGNLTFEYDYTIKESRNFDALKYPPHFFARGAFPLEVNEVIKIPGVFVMDEPHYDCLIRGPFANLNRWVVNTPDGVEIRDHVERAGRLTAEDKESMSAARGHLTEIMECGNRPVYLSERNPNSTKQIPFEAQFDLSKTYTPLSHSYKAPELFRRDIRIQNLFLKKNPNDESALYWQGVRLAEYGFAGRPVYTKYYFSSSDEVLRQLLVVNPKSASAYGRLGLNALYSEDINTARLMFDKGYALDPKNYDVLFLGGSYSQERKQLPAALGYFKAALNASGNSEQRQDSLNQQAEVLAQLGRKDEARTAYDSAIAIQPTHVTIVNNAGDLEQSRGRLDQAISLYRKSLEIARTDRAEQGLALCQALQLKQKVDQAGEKGDLDAFVNEADLLYQKDPQQAKMLELLVELHTRIAKRDRSPKHLTMARRYSEELQAQVSAKSGSARRSTSSIQEAEDEMESESDGG